VKELDLHGKKVAEAEDVFFEFLNSSRLKKELKVICLITGTGLIRERLLALCQEHDLYHYSPLANRGCVVIEFE
jgi:DNA-nicking Smr family endonuclease